MKQLRRPNLLTQQNSLYDYKMLPDLLKSYVGEPPVIKNNKSIEFINLPCAFDIETSSFYENGEKRAIMYEWTVGVAGICVYGRTWQEFMECYQMLLDYFQPHKTRKLIIYVHNLAYEFQWIRFKFMWAKVFASDERKVIYALTADGVEFRCSYFLSGYSLATLAKNLTRYHVEKLVGDLDYSLIRHSGTPLTDKELAYCENDVRVVMCYIQEKIEDKRGIQNIQLTKTGEVRKFTRDECFYDKSSTLANWKKYVAYHRLMDSMTLDVRSYQQLKRCFAGGFTHCSILKVGKVYDNVGSDDFASAYPAEALGNMFPASAPKLVTVSSREEFDYYVKYYCCVFNVRFKGLIATTMIEHPISSSRCWDVIGAVIDNGRIVSADSICMTMTEVDYKLYKKFYEWEESTVWEMTIYEKAYLPKSIMMAILKLYHNKTTLKGRDDMVAEYVNSKQMINSVYGCMVTDICRNEIVYDGEWGEKIQDQEKQINRYNKSRNRFLFYAWGVYITSYCRSHLLTMIIDHIGTDYIYSDTDSIKYLHPEAHQADFDEYNKDVTARINVALRSRGIDPEMARPKDIKGRQRQIGIFEYEGAYKRFKSLGAKRYMIENENGLSITVSGLNKRETVPYLLETYKTIDACFEAFTDDLYIPACHTGKNTHTYIDHEIYGEVTDYLGNTKAYNETSAVHMEDADYSLSIPYAFMELIQQVRETYEV